MRTRLLPHLHGPPPALPRPLDTAAERWSRWPPRLRWAVVALLVVVALVVAGRGATRSPWGPPVRTLVAAHDLEAGQTLTAADFRARRWPRELVPADAVKAVPDGGAVLAGPVPAGAVVTGRHLLDDGLASRVDAGRVAFPVARDALPALLPGQRIDLVAPTMDGGGRRLASAATVLAADDRYVWLDVARDEAPGIAGAAGRSGLTAVVLPSRPAVEGGE